jgi:hypothetical protein
MGILVDWRWAGALLALLLAIDLTEAAFYVGHILALHGQAPGWLQTPLFDMNREFGLLEDLEYGKSLICAAAMALCLRRSGETVFAALAVLHVWLTLDNAMALHEQIGVYVGDHLLRGDGLGLARATDMGQLLYHSVFGLGLVALFGVLLRRTRPGFVRTGLVLAAAAVSPGLFGVFVDAFQATPLAEPLSFTLLVVLEDGGETAMLSLSVALCIGCLRHSRAWASARADQPVTLSA